jgi:hypothetical protein
MSLSPPFRFACKILWKSENQKLPSSVIVSRTLCKLFDKFWTHKIFSVCWQNLFHEFCGLAPAWHTCRGWYCNLQLLRPSIFYVLYPSEMFEPLGPSHLFTHKILYCFRTSGWNPGHNLLLSQAFRWESLWRRDLGHNLLLSQAFRWESLWRWDLGHNLLLSQAFWWESLWWWDLGFHGAFGYQGAPFTKHFFLFLILGCHGASFANFSHDGIRLSQSLFTNFSFTRWNFGYHGAFHVLYFHMMGFRLSQSLS